MPDMGMVVKWFEFCRVEDKCSTDCPYFDNTGSARECTNKLAKDVLTLLKEQEEVTRCKDCKWYDERISMCDNCVLPREPTFFCADGKQRG